MVMDRDRIIECIVYPLYQHKCVLCDREPFLNKLWCGKCRYYKAGRVTTRYDGNYTDAVAAMKHAGYAKSAMYRLKDSGHKRTVRFFTQEMHRAINDHWSGVTFDLILPIPMNATKQAERGFNQSDLLAKRLSRLTGIPWEPGALLRKEDALTQHELGAAGRLPNARRSYAVARPELVKDRTLLLVDDLITTGATLNECAGKLLAAGARSVYVIAAQYTPLHTGRRD